MFLPYLCMIVLVFLFSVVYFENRCCFFGNCAETILIGVKKKRILEGLPPGYFCPLDWVVK